MARGKNATEKTKLIVFGRSGGRCEFRNCGHNLIGDLVSGNRSRLSSYFAHIIAADPNGPRGDQELSFMLSDDPDNIMAVCDIHHREIDDRDKVDVYTVENLKEMKQEHQAFVEKMLSTRKAKASHILQVSAPIGPNETAVCFDDCVRAMVPAVTLAGRRPIEIKIRGMRHKDSDPNYYSIEMDKLRSSFNKDIKWRFEEGEISHFSVFALAPIPLLIELGRLLSDISDCTVYALHREPKPGWAWPDEQYGPELGFAATEGCPGSKRVALKVAVSAAISDDRVRAAVGGDTSIWEIRSDRLGTSVLRKPSDLSRFRLAVGSVFDRIRLVHGSDADLSLFPAVPAACAVELGRTWQPKAHLPANVYDELLPDGFVHRTRLENV